ncbi:MAG: DUF4097 family beta strand repeat protein [Clostridia bacterium]|nr:DUF4097 family beta strand repeat protein [Clostridia bacterium]
MMKRATVIWLITASALVLIGCVIFGGVMSLLKWDFTKLSTTKYESNRYEINDVYQNISIVTDTADVEIVAVEGIQSAVDCYERVNGKHSVSVKDGTLVIEFSDTRKWYDYIGIHFGSPKVTVTVPKGEYVGLSVKVDTGDVKIPEGIGLETIDISGTTGDVRCCAAVSKRVSIHLSTGDLFVGGAEVGELDLKTSTGDITVASVTCGGAITTKVSTGKMKLSDVSCKMLSTEGSTGDVVLTNVMVSEGLSIRRSTGDVKLERCDAAEIFIKTSTGDIKGSLLSDKVFATQTNTGKIDVPKTAAGGRCEISTDTGDIKISVEK